MKTRGLLHAELSRMVAALGHTDRFCIADCGLPVPVGVPVVDLRLVFGIPSFEQVLAAVLAEVTVEHALVAAQMPEANPQAFALVRRPSLPVDQVDHEEFKRQTAQARFLVRTGEATPYANVLLTAGVAF